MLKMFILFLIIITVIYLLYLNGLIPITVKSAVTFIGGRQCKKATFTSCNGYIKRIVKLEANRAYTFTLQPKLTAGSMSVTLMDNNKQIKMQLSELEKNGTVIIEKSQRYTLMIRFQSASGEYALDWN